MILRQKKLKAVIPALIIIAGLGSIQTAYADEMIYKTTSNLNMRTDAGTSNRILLTIPKGRQITYIASKGSWYQVTYGGKNGYVSSAFVRKEKSTAQAPAASASGENLVKTTSALNIRTGPGVGYTRIGTMPSQATAVFHGQKDGWYQVTYGGKTGYASGKFLSVVKSAQAPAETVAQPVETPAPVEGDMVSTRKYYTTGTLNMRSGPTKSFGIVQVLPKGAELTYLGEEGWYKVSYNGKVGYASNRYVKVVETLVPSAAKPADPPAAVVQPPAEVPVPEVITPEPAPQPAPVPQPVVTAPENKGVLTQTTIYYTTTTLNMRTGPAATNGLILTLPKGVHLTSLGVENGWHKVTYNGQTGYASGKYLVGNSVYTADGIIIVNKGIKLPEGFNPGENPEARAAFNRMNQEASASGIKLNLFSGFRSYAYQGTLFNRYSREDGVKVAETYSARAGHSEHQTGMTFDIGGADSSKWTKSLFADTKEGKWLAANAPKHGFILRYPKGKEAITGYVFEPWHFRYVGADLAMKITASGLTLDEYYNCVHPTY